MNANVRLVGQENTAKQVRVVCSSSYFQRLVIGGIAVRKTGRRDLRICL